MADYRIINKELVEQVQILREEIAAVRKEHIFLQERIFEEQRKRVEEKQAIVAEIKKNFWLTMNAIEPNTRTSQLFTDFNKESYQTQQTNVSARRSSIRASDLRRSASLQRSSIVGVSPSRSSRRSQNGDGEDELDDVESVHSSTHEATKVIEGGLEVLAEVEEPISCSEQNQGTSSLSTSESESQDELDCSDVRGYVNVRQRVRNINKTIEDNNKENVNQSSNSLDFNRVRTVSMESGRFNNRTDLEDDTMEQSSIESDEEEENSFLSMGSDESSAALDISQESLLLHQLSTMDLDSLEKKAPFNVTEAIFKNMDQSIETARCSADVSVESRRRTIFMAENISLNSSNPSESNSTIPRFSQFMYGTCNTCSTPKLDLKETSSRPVLKEKNIITNNNNNHYCSSDESCSISRPRRKCAPTNLRDGNLKNKIRNDGKSTVTYF